jgi:serine/threonine-protein kinase
MADFAPGQTLDGFTIDSVVANGGMATIYRAQDGARAVALKVPHLEYASDLVFHERFKREEQIGLRLDHRAVLKVLPHEPKSRLYMVMEYVDGETLRARLKREGRLPIATAIRLATQIADALGYLHDCGIVHRDLKPENVMLTPDGGVRVMDFGIAHDATLRKMTWSGLSHAAGTPDYMAPEQVKGMGADARSDLYSLGVMLFEMLTGTVPGGDDESMYAAMKARVETDAPSARQLRPEISAGLDRVIRRTLSRDPARRPDSALEMREWLAYPDSVPADQPAAGRTDRPAASARARWMLLAAGAALYLVIGWILLHAGHR